MVQADGPGGGLQASSRATRAWQWTLDGGLAAAPVRCRGEQLYLVRANLSAPGRLNAAQVVIHFVQDEMIVGERTVTLAPIGPEPVAELFGWVETPPDTAHLQVYIPDADAAPHFTDLRLMPVAERDPKCHPLANVPRWNTYAPPFPLERVVLPKSLVGLADMLSGLQVEVARQPASVAALRRLSANSVCVLDLEWILKLKLTLVDLQRLAEESWLIVDLPTMANAVTAAGAAQARTVTYRAAKEIMAARNTYADVPTRGFALFDVFPYGARTAEGGFATRVIKARGWKRHADQVGCAALLESETPYVEHCKDVLMAAQGTSRGELIATDLPWLVAGKLGEPIAPRLARHQLRMLCGCPLDDALQYWNEWDDEGVLFRDIADMPRRYAGMAAIRWASEGERTAQLGLTVAAPGEPCRRQVIIRTGRADRAGVHDGLPPEAMVIFMKWLSRELREGTRWAREALAGLQVTWQFDTTAGLRNVVSYRSAAGMADQLPTKSLRLYTPPLPGAALDPVAEPLTPVERIAVPYDVGIYGDGALEYQSRLTNLLATRLESVARA